MQSRYVKHLKQTNYKFYMKTSLNRWLLKGEVFYGGDSYFY